MSVYLEIEMLREDDDEAFCADCGDEIDPGPVVWEPLPEIHERARAQVHPWCAVKNGYRLRYDDENDQLAELERIKGLLGPHWDEHVVRFEFGGDWGLQHPVRCRPDLIGCPVNRAMREKSDLLPPVQGDYLVYLRDDGSLTFERLSAPSAHDEAPRP